MSWIMPLIFAALSTAYSIAALLVPRLLAQHLGGARGEAGLQSVLAILGLTALVVWFLSMRRKLAAQCDTIVQAAKSDSNEAPLIGKSLLQPLATAVQQRLSDLRFNANAAQLRQRELEIELRVVTLERERMQSIIQSISDGVLVTDAWDELVLANTSATSVLGMTTTEKRRQPIESVLKDTKLIGLIREMRANQSTSGRRVIEHRLTKDGHDRTFKVTLSPIDKEASGVLLLMHDMTHEAEVARMKNDFVSHVSHELRTPLASIKAYIEMLIDGEARDEKQADEFYDVIQNEANRLGRLIDNILDVSRIEAGVVKANKVPLSLTVVLNEALEVIAPQAAAKQITVRHQIEPAIYQVMADKDMIYRAVLNLLSNAVKYTREGGTVTASTTIDPSQKKITVSIFDTGVGIPLKALPHVFDKFYRVEQNNGMAKGTGLGLALVKQVVETVHGGKVAVQSTEGKGSAFTIELDLC